jgi:hypothetical protein
MVDAIVALADEDLNGQLYVPGAEGEREEIVEINLIPYGHALPAAADGAHGQAVPFTVAQANRFIALQINHCRIIGLPPANAGRIAYLRFLSARAGLISPNFALNRYNVRYNDSVRLTEAQTNLAIATIMHADQDVYRVAALAVLNVANRTNLRKWFSDLVCIVAFVFRVRGHHYLPILNDLYDRVWTKCLHDPALLGLTWELIAGASLHAIMPLVLDEFWHIAKDNAQCAGALIKRWDSAPAGVAAPLVVKKGVDDIKMVFPGVENRVKDDLEYVNQCVEYIKNHRWEGSVNARYYGVGRYHVDEGRMCAIGAVVLGIYNELAPGSDLRASPALQRLAGNAPVVSGAMGRAAGRAVADTKLSLIGEAIHS